MPDVANLASKAALDINIADIENKISDTSHFMNTQ